MNQTTHPTTRTLIDALTAELRADATTWFAEPARLVLERPADGGPVRTVVNPAWTAMRNRRRRIEALRRQLLGSLPPAVG